VVETRTYDFQSSACAGLQQKNHTTSYRYFQVAKPAQHHQLQRRTAMLQLRFAVDAMYTASFKAEHTFQNRETVQESKTNLGPGPTIRNVRPKQLRKHDRSRLIESISGVQQQGHVRLRQFEHIVLLVPQSGCRLPNKKAGMNGFRCGKCRESNTGGCVQADSVSSDNVPTQ
jgi:hypothetical protein